MISLKRAVLESRHLKGFNKISENRKIHSDKTEIPNRFCAIKDKLILQGSKHKKMHIEVNLKEGKIPEKKLSGH